MPAAESINARTTTHEANLSDPLQKEKGEGGLAKQIAVDKHPIKDYLCMQLFVGKQFSQPFPLENRTRYRLCSNDEDNPMR